MSEPASEAYIKYAHQDRYQGGSITMDKLSCHSLELPEASIAFT
jgi:hypothetical protein